MRVVLADPPAFTPPYDHELAAALAREGADVQLVTSRFRFGETPAPGLLPRRTAARHELWRSLLARFDRVVVHSERGRETLAPFGVDARVIPHPVFRSDPPRSDDGRTVLALGVIRPYKGLGDAI